MSEQSSGPSGPQGPPGPPPGAAPPQPSQSYPPAGAAYAPGPSGPMPQWYPAVPKRPFSERVIKLWVALAVALACLVVGLGVGVAIGHATADDDRGPGRFDRFPGGPGMRDGHRFGFGNRPRLHDGPRSTPQPPTPSPTG